VSTKPRRAIFIPLLSGFKVKSLWLSRTLRSCTYARIEHKILIRLYAAFGPPDTKWLVITYFVYAWVMHNDITSFFSCSSLVAWLFSFPSQPSS
jgi:hypothetical protein